MLNDLINKTKTVFLFLAFVSLIIASGLCQADTTTIISKIVNMDVPENIDFSQAFEESTFILEISSLVFPFSWAINSWALTFSLTISCSYLFCCCSSLSS